MFKEGKRMDSGKCYKAAIYDKTEEQKQKTETERKPRMKQVEENSTYKNNFFCKMVLASLHIESIKKTCVCSLLQMYPPLMTIPPLQCCP